MRSADAWFSPLRFSALLAILIFTLYLELLLGSHSLFFRDFGHFGFPLAHYFRESFWQGEIPLWNPLNHCGIPFLAQWNTLVFYPLSAIYLILPLNWGLNFFCLLHLFLGGLGMYFLTRSCVRNNFAASVAGFIFTFNGLTSNSIMWPAIISALGLMPWVVWCTVAAWRNGGRRMILAALIGTAQMFTGGVEIILFTWLFLAIFCAGDLLAHEISRACIFRRFTAIVLLIAGLSAIQILPFLDLLQHSQRSDSSLGGISSMPALGWANFLVPLFGTLQSTTGLYFQPGQWWLTSYYLGIGSVALVLVALVSMPSRRHITLGLLAAFFLTLALGDAGFLYKWLLSAFPPLGLIRYPVKFVIPVAFIVPILAGVTISKTATAVPAQARRLRIRTVVVGTMLLFLLGLIGWYSYNYPVSKDLVDATGMNALVRGLFLAAILMLLLFRLNSGSSLSRTMQLLLRCGFLFLLWLDVWTHAPKQAPTIPKELLVADLKTHRGMSPLPVAGESRAMLSRAAQATFDRTLLGDSAKSYLGIRLGLYCNCNLLEDIPKVDGFYPLNLKRPAAIENRLYNIPELNEGVLNFLAVSQITADGGVTEWRHRTNYLPMISAGQKPVFAADAEALRGIFAREFDPATMIYLPEDARTQVPVTHQAQARILVHRFDNHSVSASVRAEETSVVSIAQAFHHSWKGYIDGTPARVWLANYAFQALVVPPGDHEILLLYRDSRFLAGIVISIASLLICLIAWLRLDSNKT